METLKLPLFGTFSCKGSAYHPFSLEGAWVLVQVILIYPKLHHSRVYVKSLKIIIRRKWIQQVLIWQPLPVIHISTLIHWFRFWFRLPVLLRSIKNAFIMQSKSRFLDRSSTPICPPPLSLKNFSGPNDVISIDHVLPTGTFCLAYAHIGILYVNEHDFLSPCLFEQLYFDWRVKVSKETVVLRRWG